MLKKIEKICSLLLFIATLSLFPIAFIFIRNLELTDFEIYRHAAFAYRDGKNIYAQAYGSTLGGEVISLRYFYPPFLAWLLSYGAPSTYLKDIWILVSLLSLFLSIFVLSQFHWPENNVSKIRNFTMLCLYVALWPPMLDGLSWGQVNTLVFFPLTLSYCSLLKGEFVVSAISLAVAIAIKGTPVWLLIPCIVFRHYKLVTITLLAVVALNLPTVFGPNGVQTFHGFISSLRSIGFGDVTVDPFYDYSFEQVLTPFLDDRISRIFGVGIRCFLFLWLIISSYRFARYDQASIAAPFLQGITIMIVTAPMVWFHHISWAVLVLVEAFYLFDKNSFRINKILIGAVYFLLGFSLYIHVIVRHHLGYGENLVKLCIPALLIFLTLLLSVNSKAGLSSRARDN